MEEDRERYMRYYIEEDLFCLEFLNDLQTKWACTGLLFNLCPFRARVQVR